MQLSNTLVVFASLLTLTSAIPQTPAQTTAAAEALASLISDLRTGAGIQSVASALETDTAAYASLQKFEASLASVVSAQGTLAPNYLDGIPIQVRPFFSSFVQAEASIMTANGFKNPIPTDGVTPLKGTAAGAGSSSVAGTVGSSSSKAAAARETGLGGMGRVAVAGAVGFVGVVMAL